MISETLAILPGKWSPPSSPDPYENPVVCTDDRGMVVDPFKAQSASFEGEVTPIRKKRCSLQYVSRHFTPPHGQASERMADGERSKTKRRKLKQDKENEVQKIAEVDYMNGVSNHTQQDFVQDLRTDSREAVPYHTTNATDPVVKQNESESWQEVAGAPGDQQPRIFFGLSVDEMSSDSDLTDVPDDIGPNPFLTPAKESSTRRQKNRKPKSPRRKEKSPEKKAPKPSLTKSPYFPHAHKPRPTFLSTLPFPPLNLDRFGLMQERLCHDPFRLLLATIFLNKTPGSRAMPIFFQLMERYPTPTELARAQQADVTAIIHELGFQNQRARKVIAMAAKWVEQPPVKGVRYRKVDYPKKGDGKDIRTDEIVDDVDGRVAWEISHLPGLGPYSHDSWRMFCRDELRGLSPGYNGENGKANDNVGDEVFEPEWKRVLPTDKELRAWMTWNWMKEGYVWNKETGTRTKASEELMDLARGEGNVVLEESEKSTLVVKSLEEDRPSPLRLPEQTKRNVKIETPAGEFIPPGDD